MNHKLIITLLLAFALAACTANPGPGPSPLPGQTALTPTAALPTATLPPTPTPLPPTPTPEPLAARVNGQGISLAAYNAELQRLQAGLKETGKELPAADQRARVLDELVNQALLAQAAAKNGFKLEDAAFQTRLDSLVKQGGGTQAFNAWLKNNFYDEAGFRKDLRLSIAAAWQRDQVYASAPTTADQVHARQILLLESATAERFFNLLKAGADFASLAYQADPELGGDLGWFPKGYLLLPEIEKAAFELEPGKYSQIIKTSYGYQIIQVIERDPQHALSDKARRIFQEKQLSDWLAEQRSKSSIEVLLSTQ